MQNRFNEITPIFSEDPVVSYKIIEDSIQKAYELVPKLKDISDVQDNLYSISRAINLLDQAQLLDFIDVDFLISHQNSYYFAEGLIILNQVGISHDYRHYLESHSNPHEVAESFEFLDKFELLNHQHADLISKSLHPKNLALALQCLNLNQIFLPQELEESYLDELAKLVLILAESGLLNQPNIDTLSSKSQDFLSNTNSLLMFIKESKFINQENFNVVMNLDSAQVVHISHAFMFLFANRLSNQANFDALLKVADTTIFVFALCKMSFARILTQANFNLLITLVNSALLSVEAQEIIWYQIPDNLLTQEVFNLLVQASGEENPLERFEEIILEVLGMDDEQLDVNDPQSTHTASVHRSVSKSAKQLHHLYGNQLYVDNLFPNITDFANQLDETNLKQLAAKRCISRFLEKYHSFSDPDSNLNLMELLGLVFLAIHDEKLRIGSLYDAKALLIDALYEIQRGYNLDDKGFDLGGEDKPICAAGSFNKLIEKLVGIHQSCEIVYITPNLASLKLQTVVINQANAYLKGFVNPKSMQQALLFLALMHEIKGEGIGVIWLKILDKVKWVMHQDFQEISGLEDIIDAGQFVQIENLDRFQKQFEASMGYAKLNQQILISSSQLSLKLNQHSLWANRNHSPQSQILFDKQWGLSPVKE